MLRPVTPADAEAFHAVANHAGQTRMTGTWRYPFTVEDVRTRWQPFFDAGPDGQVLMAIIEGDKLAGTTGLHAPEAGRAELSYWIGEGFEGRGLATEAATAMCGFAFARRGLDELTARAFADNEPSLRILRRLGFEVVSEDETHAADREGVWPSFAMRLTREDWLS
ncbi:GNAT family N-acetyltransferase [Parvularcula dongshanensis]|uniref:RimJ/RimL family protein N-acetyltransferase n=1 Tax=Parvularcula dongshanensis TaxID=1173995 RepID=A0A840I574_9PROT|nr:GNAT family N-acetyltransferase [Parvularcula dongshanensis]MBB4659318.1 RimJ/RimL family protein N-acetyltransferase [Parvularcula dongshanensis]